VKRRLLGWCAKTYGVKKEEADIINNHLWIHKIAIDIIFISNMVSADRHFRRIGGSK